MTNTLKEVYTSSVGGLLEFHCYMLCTVFPICGYVDFYLDTLNTNQHLVQLDIFGRYVFTTAINVVTSLQSILDVAYIEGCLANIVLTNLKIVENKFHALSRMSIRRFLFSMSAFLFTTNRMTMSYGDAMDITKAEKRLHTFKVLCEWPSAREQTGKYV